jgi:hypothetical protein
MNVKFTSDQSKQFATMRQMFGENKMGDQPDDVKSAAGRILQKLNDANDKDWGMVRDILALVAEFGITKDSNKDKIPEMLAKLEALRASTAGPKKESPKAEKPKAEPKIDPAIMAKVKAKMEANPLWDRSKVGSYMNLEFDIKGVLAKAYLDMLFVKAEKAQRSGHFASFLDLLRNGPMSDAQWEAWLKGTTENNRNHSSQFKAIKDTVNAVWAKK